jgi:hypothetical protein
VFTVAFAVAMNYSVLKLSTNLALDGQVFGLPLIQSKLRLKLTQAMVCVGLKFYAASAMLTSAMSFLMGHDQLESDIV